VEYTVVWWGLLHLLFWFSFVILHGLFCMGLGWRLVAAVIDTDGWVLPVY